MKDTLEIHCYSGEFKTDLSDIFNAKIDFSKEIVWVDLVALHEAIRLYAQRARDHLKGDDTVLALLFLLLFAFNF